MDQSLKVAEIDIKAQTVALETFRRSGDRLEMGDEPKRGAQDSSLFLP